MRTITRDALYEQVWRTPLRALAAEYGLSDVGLAKVCKRLDVPRPPQGHWQRVQHGHDSVRPSLPPLSAGIPAEFVVDDVPSTKKQAANRAEVPRVPVSEKLLKPLEVVKELFELLKPDFRITCARVVRYPHQVTLRVSPAHEDRAKRIIDALCRWIVDNGHQISVAELPTDRRLKMLLVGRGDEAFRISVLERLKQIEHPPTADEKARTERLGLSSRSRTELVPTGKFTLDFLHARLSHTSYGSWKDGRRPLEDQLGEAALRVPEVFASIAQEKRMRDENQRRATHEAISRAAEAERERYDDDLAEDLDEMANEWEHANRIRNFLNVAEPVILANAKGDPTARRAWLAWAHAYADSIDPVCEPNSIAKALSADDD